MTLHEKLSCDAIYVTPSVQHVSFCHLGLLCIRFPAEKPLVSCRETDGLSAGNF